MTDNLKTCVDPYLDSFAQSFAAAGYKAGTIRTYRHLARKLGRLMDAEGVEPSALTPNLADQLARTEARGPDARIRFHHFTRRFAEHLIDIGVAQPVPVSEAQAARAELLADFEAYLVKQRGLAPRTVAHTSGFANRFLAIIPPGPSGEPWRLTTRQFRRTVAWHIANRPFGTVAGMIQYKHASVAAFESYAGASASGFRADVEAQRRLGQLDDILVYFDERQAGAPSGPAGPRIARSLHAAADDLAPMPGMIADRARLRTLLGSLARTLHVGMLADCFCDPATALCLKQASQPAPAPPTALCQPTRCPNACITDRHRPAWARAADDARELLGEKRLPEPQRVALRRDLGRIEAVLDGIGGSADPEREREARSS